jgi:hypothetical protein
MALRPLWSLTRSLMLSATVTSDVTFREKAVTIRHDAVKPVLAGLMATVSCMLGPSSGGSFPLYF